MTFHRGGQNICGISVGVLSLESYFPKPPGHIKNPSGLQFTTAYEILHGLTVPDLLGNPTPEMLQPIIDAARRLEAQGVRAITGSCGFLALFQREIAEAVDIPVFVSSLVQVPLAYHMTQAPVGIVTASAPALTERHMESVGAAGIPIEVEGLENSEEFASVILQGQRTGMDLAKVEEEFMEAGRRLVNRNPDIRAIVLECTDLPPYAHRLQAELGLPVFDLTTLATMVSQTVSRQAFSGII